MAVKRIANFKRTLEIDFLPFVPLARDGARDGFLREARGEIGFAGGKQALGNDGQARAVARDRVARLDRFRFEDAGDFDAHVALLLEHVDGANGAYDAGKHSSMSNVSGCNSMCSVACHRSSERWAYASS